MILACGTCAHWIVWTAFPAATPWAVVFAIWFLALSVVAAVSRTKLTAVPRLPVAVALVLGSLALGVALFGPLAGFWLPPACLLGSASAIRLTTRPRVRLNLLLVTAAALVALVALGAHSILAYRKLSPTERVLKLEHTPAWPIELRRVARGDCATLGRMAAEASATPLAQALEKRLAAECRR